MGISSFKDKNTSLRKAPDDNLGRTSRYFNVELTTWPPDGKILSCAVESTLCFVNAKLSVKTTPTFIRVPRTKSRTLFRAKANGMSESHSK